MNAKILLISAALFSLSTMGWAAPQQSYGQQAYSASRPSPGDDLNNALRQLKIGLADLKHEMQNHEAEIHIFDNKLQSQEANFEHLRQQLIDDLQSQRDFARASSINLEGKVKALDQSMNNIEAMVRGLTNDLRQIKTQSNDSVAVLGQYKQKIAELDNLLQAQSQHMQNLEAALQAMMEVWQAKETAKEIANKGSSEGEKTYKVQAGDSLEKIARANKISVQALRDANQLTNDRILVGQTLKIP